jgi:hypothetical protein
MRVEQTMISDKDRPSWEGTLTSGVLKVPLGLLRAERLPGTDPISEVVLNKSKEGKTLTTEEFKRLMKTAERQGFISIAPHGDFSSFEDSLRWNDPANDWYNGHFSTPHGAYQFHLGMGGLNRLVAPGGTSVIFRFKRDAEN